MPSNPMPPQGGKDSFKAPSSGSKRSSRAYHSRPSFNGDCVLLTEGEGEGESWGRAEGSVIKADIGRQ
jgi:hypothetical protein